MLPQVLRDIERERLNARQLQAEGKFSYTTYDRVSDHLKLAILVEEVGEIGKALNEGKDNKHIREELVQVAGIVIDWIECLDLSKPASPAAPGKANA